MEEQITFDKKAKEIDTSEMPLIIQKMILPPYSSSRKVVECKWYNINKYSVDHFYKLIIRI